MQYCTLPLKYKKTEMRKAFYAGALFIMEKMNEIGAMSEDDGVEELGKLQTEADCYVEDFLNIKKTKH